MHNPTSDDNNNESVPFDIEKKRGYRNCLKRYSVCGYQNEFDRMEWKKSIKTGLTLKYWHRNAFQVVDYDLILLHGFEFELPIT